MPELTHETVFIIWSDDHLLPGRHEKTWCDELCSREFHSPRGISIRTVLLASATKSEDVIPTLKEHWPSSKPHSKEQSILAKQRSGPGTKTNSSRLWIADIAFGKEKTAGLDHLRGYVKEYEKIFTNFLLVISVHGHLRAQVDEILGDLPEHFLVKVQAVAPVVDELRRIIGEWVDDRARSS